LASNWQREQNFHSITSKGLNIESVEVERGGQRSHVLVVNESVIFKFPRMPDGVEEFVRESALLRRLRGRLPLPIPEPVYENLDSVTIETLFLGYVRLPGQPLWRETLLAQSEPAQTTIAKQLGHFLQALHATPTESLGVALPIQDTHQSWTGLHTRIVEKLFPCMRSESRRLVSAHFEPYLEEPGALAHAPVLRHGDFGPTNILFDSSTSQLSGVIDFASVALGDPAVDLASMLGPFGYGEEFLNLVIAAYPELQSCFSRARFYAGTFALQEALWGMEHDNKDAFERGIAMYE
jgi:aminoglycoside 2''-phosphotransferase